MLQNNIETAPKKRSDCKKEARPCPWIRCKYHAVWLQKGIKEKTNDEICDLIFSMPETCILDVADKGGETLEKISTVMGITRERVRQLLTGKAGIGVDEKANGGAIRRLQHATRKKELSGFYNPE